MRHRGWIEVTRIVAIMVLAIVGLGTGALYAAPAQQNAQTVQMLDFKFEPKTITVPVGTVITWKNDGAAPHTATADDGSFDTGNVDASQSSKAITFDKAGTFAYYCVYHGSKGGVGMAGTIVVTEAQATQPTPTTDAQPAQPTPTTAPASSGPAPSLTVGDQPIQDGGIIIPEVVAAQDGWMVAHKNTADNKPGPVIGSVAVKAGTNTNVKIALSETPKVGDKLWPMLHIDAGVIGTYEFPGPDAPVIVNGDMIMKQITITAASSSGGSAPTPPPATLPTTGASDSLMIWAALVALGVLGAGLGLRRRMIR